MLKITRLTKNQKGQFYLTAQLGNEDQFIDLDITSEIWEELIDKLTKKDLISEMRVAAKTEYYNVK